METRNISVTLEQAIGWYNSGNDTLRTLALNAYTKDELGPDHNSIDLEVDQICTCVCIPRREEKKFLVLAKLATIAKYYNKDWEKTACNIGYYICNCSTGNNPIASIHTSSTVQYAGVVYFKNYEDAIKAIRILGDEAKELFK